MPRVPLPSIGQQQSQSAPYDAPGGAPMQDIAGRTISQAGAAVSGVGMAVQSAAMVLQDQVDDAKVKEGFTQFANRASLDLTDPNGGYLNLTGKAAVGHSRAKVLGGLESRMSEIEQGLDNETQRGMFREAAAKHLIGVRERVFGHEAQEMRVWNAGQSKAMAIQATRSAIEAWMGKPTTPDAHVAAAAAQSLAAGEIAGQGTQESRAGQEAAAGLQGPAGKDRQLAEFNLHKNTAIQQVNAQADLLGLGKDDPQRQLMVTEATTAIHSGIVESLLGRGRGTEAREYFESVPAGEVDVEVGLKIQSALRRADLTASAAKIADDVVAATEMTITAKRAQETGLQSYRDDVFGGDAINMASKLIAKARQDESITVEEADAAMDRVNHAFTMRRQAYNDQGAAAMQQVISLQGRDPTLSIKSPSFPPTLYAQLERYGRLDDAQKILRADRDSDPATYKKLFDYVNDGRLSKMSPSEFFNEFKPGLNGVEWNHAMSFYERANAREDKPVNLDKDDVLGLAAATGLIDDVKQGPKNAEKALQMILFGKEIERRLKGVQNPDWDTKLRVAREVTSEESKKQTVDGGWFSRDQKKWPWEVDQNAWSLGPGGDKVFVNQSINSDANALAFMGQFRGKKLPEPTPDFVHWVALKGIKPEVTKQVIETIEATGKTVNQDSFYEMWKQLTDPNKLDESKMNALRGGEWMQIDPSRVWREGRGK